MASTAPAPSSSTASTRLANGPARLTTVRCHLVIDPVRSHTAPPGRPMPPSATNSSGSPSDSIGLEYFSGFSVR